MLDGSGREADAQQEVRNMEFKITACESCEREVKDEEQKRKENWIEIMGGNITGGIKIWLDKPRKEQERGKPSGMVNSGYIHKVGWQNRAYHFCSIKCLVKALEQAESM